MKLLEYTSEKYPGKLFTYEDSMADLCKDIEVEGFSKKQIKEICKMFLEKMCTDLIMNNAIFIFPVRGFGFIRIQGFNKDSEYYQANINTDGILYSPVIRGDGWRKVERANRRIYDIRFQGKMQEKFEKEINSGHLYAA